jgi:hypothetical protein
VEAAAIHTGAARTLLGRDLRDNDRVWADLYCSFDYQILQIKPEVWKHPKAVIRTSER